MQTGTKEELIKLIQNIPEDFVYEAIEIIRQILRREEAWDDFFSLMERLGLINAWAVDIDFVQYGKFQVQPLRKPS